MHPSPCEHSFRPVLLAFLFALSLVACDSTVDSEPAAQKVSLTSGDSPVQVSEKDLPEVLGAVRREGRGFLERIPQGREKSWGFSERSQFMRAQAGEPWAMVTLLPKDLSAIRSGRAQFRPVNQWRVPVLVDGEARALWTVARVAGTMRVVEVGAAGLARELAQVEQVHQVSKTRALLRVFPLRSDFALFSQTESGDYFQKAVPLTSAHMYLGLTGGRAGAPLARGALLDLLDRAFAARPEVRP